MQRHPLEALKDAFKIYNKYFEFIKREAEKNNAPDDVMTMIAMAQLNLADAKLHRMTVDEYLKLARQMPALIPKEYLLPPFPANISMTDFKNLLDVYDLQQYGSSDVFSNVINLLAKEEDDDRFIGLCEIARDHSLFPDDDPHNFKTRFELLRGTRAEAVDWVKKAKDVWKFYNILPLQEHNERLRSITAKREELQKLPIIKRGLFIVESYKRIRAKNPDISQAKPGVKMFMNHFIESLHAIEDLHKTILELRTLEEDLRRNVEDLTFSLRMAYMEKKSRTLELVLLYHDQSKVMKALQAFSLVELKVIRRMFNNDYISNMIEKLPVYKEAMKNESKVRKMIDKDKKNRASAPMLAKSVANSDGAAEADKDKKKKDKLNLASESASTMFAAKPKEKDKTARASVPALMYPAKPAKEKPKKHKEEVKGKGKDKTKDKSGDKIQKPATKKKR